jgi:hypothetical protein
MGDDPNYIYMPIQLLQLNWELLNYGIKNKCPIDKKLNDLILYQFVGQTISKQDLHDHFTRFPKKNEQTFQVN